MMQPCFLHAALVLDAPDHWATVVDSKATINVLCDYAKFAALCVAMQQTQQSNTEGLNLQMGLTSSLVLCKQL